MGAKGAAEIIFRKEIASSDDPAAKLAEKEAEYAELFAHPYNAAARGYVDEVINPRDTREKLIAAFDMLRNKVSNNPRKKHVIYRFNKLIVGLLDEHTVAVRVKSVAFLNRFVVCFHDKLLSSKCCLKHKKCRLWRVEVCK